MAWSDARDNLLTALRTLGKQVHVTPPQVIDDEDVHILLTPPARDVLRRAGGVRRTTYDQRIAVMRHIPNESDADVDSIALSVDDCAEDVDNLLDVHLQLSGAAVSVNPPVWDELTVSEYPSGSGLLVALILCTLTIEVERIGEFRTHGPSPVPVPTGTELYVAIQSGDTFTPQSFGFPGRSGESNTDTIDVPTFSGEQVYLAFATPESLGDVVEIMTGGFDVSTAFEQASDISLGGNTYHVWVSRGLQNDNASGDEYIITQGVVAQHVSYVAIKATDVFIAPDFTAAGYSDASSNNRLDIPAFTGVLRYVAFAVPTSAGNVTAIMTGGFDVTTAFEEMSNKVTIAGDAHYVWISRAALNDNASGDTYVLTQG